MFSQLDPEVVFQINIYWKSLVMIGSIACLIVKAINWKHQQVHGAGSLIFLGLVALSNLLFIGAGLGNPGYFRNPTILLENAAHTSFLFWYSWTKCWPSFRGEAVTKPRRIPVPMAYH